MNSKSDWYRVARDMFARDLWVTVPLDWGEPNGEQIRVFAREIVSAETLRNGVEEIPAIVYLQGGPGGKSNRPGGRDAFLSAALPRFRVVFPDQRGTGRSTAVTPADFSGLSTEEGGKRLSHYRQDSIIRDFEKLRKTHFDSKKWWTIGQSYGGFLTLAYLSHAPEALTACAITGGLPSLDPNPEKVYANTINRVRSKNELFFNRFPFLVERVSKIADILEKSPIELPDGDFLTVRRFQTLGVMLGMEAGLDRLHWILDEAFTDEAETVLSDTFIHEVWQTTNFAIDPLFMILQEAIYGPGPSNWAADRERAKHADFSESARPLLFTGEMAFEWMSDEIKALRGFSQAWKTLASNEWPLELYDTKKLAQNSVPVEAAVYFDDMYVPAEFSLDTQRRVKNLEVLITNEFEHDGVRTSDTVEKLFKRLEVRLANHQS